VIMLTQVVGKSITKLMLYRLKKAENWLTHFRLYPCAQIHASGHLGYDEIKDFIQTAQPKTLIPVHTQNPEIFKNFHDRGIIPEKGVRYTV